MAFEEKLRKLRIENNMTQEQVANLINVSRSTIAGYETKHRQPSHEKLTALANIFHVSVDYLLNDNVPILLTAAPSSDNPSAGTLSNDTSRLLSIYYGLSSHSKKDLLKYAHLLELGDKEKSSR